jgi:hypothetical protein
MNEEKLDTLLAHEALKTGWAESKTKYAARILKHLRTELKNKPILPYVDMVIKYLEEYEFDE